MTSGSAQVSEADRNSPREILSPILKGLLLIGICVHLLGFLVFRVISNPFQSSAENASFVQFVAPERLHSGAELEEQAALFDSAPLFVAGPWNAAYNLTPPRIDRTLQKFPLYKPEMNLSKELVPSDISVGANYAVNDPVDLLATQFWDLFRGLERSYAEIEALEKTRIFVEVRTLSGRVILSQETDFEWNTVLAIQPARYFLRLEAGGRILGRPTLSVSSGDAGFDRAAYEWLIMSGLASELELGYFEIVIYP